MGCGRGVWPAAADDCPLALAREDRVRVELGVGVGRGREVWSGIQVEEVVVLAPPSIALRKDVFE